MLIDELQKIMLKQHDFTEILGQKEAKKSLSSALAMGRNIVIVGPPGVGKTTLAKNIAKLLPPVLVNADCSYNCSQKNPVCPFCKSRPSKKTKKIEGERRFIRVQGSPDLTVEDLIGDIEPVKAFKYGALSLEAFTPGKVFKANNGVLFFDELNRCPEKIQNALLQALEEKKITIASYDVDFNVDFIFIATINPEDTATEKLSDVLIDRFDFIYMGYPEDIETEKEIVKRKGRRLAAVSDNLLTLMVYFVRLLRESEKLEKKPSVRASIGLYERSQSNASLDNRNEVDFKDVEEVFVSVLSHRIRLKPSARYLQSTEDFVRERFEKEIKGKFEDIEPQEELEKMGGDG